MSKELGKRYPEIWNRKVIWENNPDDKRLAELYNNSSFIIIPTIWESFNVISIEASFFRKAIIITETTGSSFLFKHKEDALIIKPGDADELAGAIPELNSSPALCDMLGQAAYKTISELLTENKIVEERLSIYMQTIKDTTKKDVRLDSLFFNRYTTFSRLVYFSCRRLIKKILKG
jgi:glycosyltransferase involved in cell wall biosynthesis